MTLQQRIKAPSREREGAGVRVPARTKSETSETSLPRNLPADKTPQSFNGHHFLCFFRQEPIYCGNPSGLYFLREKVLVALTREDLDALSHSLLPFCFPKLRGARG